MSQYDGFELLYALSRKSDDQYSVTTMFNDLGEKLTYIIKGKTMSIAGEFLYDGTRTAYAYSCGFPISEHVPMGSKVPVGNQSEIEFINDFISSRI